MQVDQLLLHVNVTVTHSHETIVILFMLNNPPGKVKSREAEILVRGAMLRKLGLAI